MSKEFNAAESARLKAIAANPGVGAAILSVTIARPRDPQATPDAPKAPLPR